MTDKQEKFWRIRRRLAWNFSLVVIVIVTVFSLFNLIFMYTVEDTFFNRTIHEEKKYLQAEYQRTGNLPVPRQSSIQLLISRDDLPADIKTEFSEEPNRPEYAGTDGRHYHLSYSKDPEFILISEVSDSLVVRDFKADVFRFLFIVTIMLLLLALGLAFLVGKQLASPIESLANLFKDAKPDELPTGFADNYPNNEVGILASGMEQAVGRINEFIVREQNFTRDVSHELRTPVAVMKGAMEVLEANEGKMTPEMVSRINSAILLMEQNIETLLMLAREQHPDVATNCDLVAVIEQSIIDNAHLLEGKSVEVDMAIEGNLNVSAPKGIAQILLNNLISNAFQHTREGTVIISSHAVQSITITDSGDGIDQAIKEDVFSSFVKGENSAGFGVGLSIVKRLCEHYHWKIELNSSATGTEITVHF